MLRILKILLKTPPFPGTYSNGFHQKTIDKDDIKKNMTRIKYVGVGDSYLTHREFHFSYEHNKKTSKSKWENDSKI
jgi:hypothetical protein